MVDAERFEEKTSRTRLVLTGVAGMVVAALVFGVATLFLAERERGLVILRADSEPYKVRPSDPGGKKLDNLDSPVLGMLDPLNKEQSGREVLTPPETAPEPPPIKAGEPEAGGQGVAAAPDAAPGAAPDSESPAEKGGAGEGAAPADEATADAASGPDAAPKAGEAAPSTGTGGGQAGTAAAPAGTGSEAGEIDKAVAQVDRPPSNPDGSPRPGADGPRFVVQFAAFRSEKNATSTAAVLASKHESRLGGVGITHAHSGEFWRVVTDPLPRAEANTLCTKFRSVGQDCIVKLMEQTP